MERVKLIQKALNNSYNSLLAIDGIMGPRTKKELQKHIIKINAKNAYVKTIQRILYLNGENIIVDGIYGNKTKEIIKKIQKNNNLKIDGIIGINTVLKIIE